MLENIFLAAETSEDPKAVFWADELSKYAGGYSAIWELFEIIEGIDVCDDRAIGNESLLNLKSWMKKYKKDLKDLSYIMRNLGRLEGWYRTQE